MKAQLFLALVFVISPFACNAENYGAIAYDLKSNAYGVTWDQGTQGAADSTASSQCATISQNCKVVVRFANTCGAYATGPNEIWGTGTGGSRTVAEQAAKYFCDQQAAANGPFCKVRVWGCNTQVGSNQIYNSNPSAKIDIDANRRNAEQQRQWGGQEQYDRSCRESGGCG
jgi:hypothetical protein